MSQNSSVDLGCLSKQHIEGHDDMMVSEESSDLMKSVQKIASSEFCGVPFAIIFCIFLAVIVGTAVSVVLPADQKLEVIDQRAAAQARSKLFVPATGEPIRAQGSERAPG